MRSGVEDRASRRAILGTGFFAAAAVALGLVAAGVAAPMGAFIGILPVVIALIFYPVLRTLRHLGLEFVLTLTIGLLAFLLAETFLQGLELAEGASAALEGQGTVLLAPAIVFLSAFAGLGRPMLPAGLALALATYIALGIGLDEFSEAIAIVAAFATGAVGLPVEPLTLLKAAHLLAVAAALGAALAADALFLIRGVLRPITAATIEAGRFLAQIVTVGLVALWVTGIPFAVKLYQANPDFVGNEKFWVKIFIVVVLSLNAFLIHHHVLPRVEGQQGRRLFDGLSMGERLALAASGGVSFVSWMFPTFLGTAKELSYVVPADQILIAYYITLAAVVTGFSVMALAAGRAIGPLAFRPSH